MGTGISKVTGEETREAFGPINDRSKKVLGYGTVNEVYQEMLHST